MHSILLTPSFSELRRFLFAFVLFNFLNFFLKLHRVMGLNLDPFLCWLHWKAIFFFFENWGFLKSGFIFPIKAPKIHILIFFSYTYFTSAWMLVKCSLCNKEKCAYAPRRSSLIGVHIPFTQIFQPARVSTYLGQSSTHLWTFIFYFE